MKPSNVNPEQVAAELVERIAKELTFHHQDLHVKPSAVGRSWTITTQCHQADMPRLIGGQGLHSKALDCVVAAIGNKYGANIRFRLLEPEVGVGKFDRYQPFRAAENWNSSEVLKLLGDICDHVFTYPVKIDSKDTDASASAIEVLVSPKEKGGLVEPIRKSLQILFNAVGKANGRVLLLDIITEGTHSDRDLGAIFG